MKILCLYNNPCAEGLFEWIKGQGHETFMCSGRVTAEWCGDQRFDLAVSYTYRYILTGAVLRSLGGNAVNLHNSYLPWNRGADPNIWSILDGTPRGVTLHYMDQGLDKGNVIAQKLVPLGKEETLRSSYDVLDRAAKDLFKEVFVLYPYWNGMKKKVLGIGTYHSLDDGRKVKEKINSYDMTVEEYRRAVLT